MSSDTIFEIRCPIHGFIRLKRSGNKALVDTEVFQRLRRIRQSAWTDYVYPGAMHTRFEHSLGVMHIATLLFDSIVANSRELLTDAYGYDEHGLAKARQKIRLAQLLHHVGHPPLLARQRMSFHSGGADAGSRELPFKSLDAARYQHEDYTYALIEGPLRETVERHTANKNYDSQRRT